MPLGLMPGMEYKEIEASLTSGQTLVLSSDGLVEAHNNQGEMYGFGRFKSQLAALANQGETIPAVMKSWHEFTGEDHEQEDDITLVSLRFRDTGINANASESWDPVTTFDLPSRPGEERQASQRVLEALKPFDLPAAQERRLGTAVAEATMNAMEHGNHYQEDIPVKIEVLQSDSAVAVRIRDFGKNPIEDVTVEPDIDAKLAGQQSPRGWGLFLIKNLVDDIKVTQDDEYHTIELILYRQV